ncbi:MAG TPA: D-alanyl-lipoteichoic acid biosynthesis protein DltD [Gemmatimonadales bacterium]|nr:D-alanyl-lipoteichoic acid biosynthesis protein DltD [Gemmatimonadales bacterium]
MATRIMVIKNRGLLLQETALARPDLLPIYAGSELVRVRANRATEFFAGAPTGFAVFPVADLGIPPLIQAENLAALAPHLRGRKLVLLISSPGYVRKEGPQRRAGYDGNFSRLHATAALTSLRLTPEIRRGFARRMRDYPGSLENDPLLDATTATLADTTVAGAWAYALLWPLNQARLLLLRASDAARVINELRGHVPPRPAPQPAPDWDELLAHAESTYRANSASNPFSFGDAWWTRYGAMLSRQQGRGSDSGFAAHMADSPWWRDLELGLATLRAEGARPLVLNIPLAGTFLTYAGVSPAARAAYYDRLHRLSERYGFPVVDLREHDQDRLFLSDQDGHPSPAGWVHLDRMINAFYHDSLR